MIDLVPGEVLKRRELHRRYGGQRQGGISTPADEPVVLLFTGDQGEQYGYNDGFRDDGSFWYTGEGQIGNMEMVRGNLAIATHRESGKDLHLFAYLEPGLVQYRGKAEYIGHHIEVAPDRNGNPRNVIVFELFIEGSGVGVAELNPDPVRREPAALWNRSLDRLRDEAFAAARDDMLVLGGHRVVYYRSNLIKVYVLRRANGICEGCGSPAPFSTTRGNPYLEPHHLRRRADGGPDHPRWVIALCPNCHARVHHGADGHDFNTWLADRLLEIEPAAHRLR